MSKKKKDNRKISLKILLLFFPIFPENPCYSQFLLMKYKQNIQVFEWIIIPNFMLVFSWLLMKY